MTYFATKYDSAATDVLHTLSVEWTMDTYGTSEAPTGWFTEPFEVGLFDLDKLREYFTSSDQADDEESSGLFHLPFFWKDSASENIADVIETLMADNDMSKEERDELVDALDGWHMVGGNDQGFVYSRTFTNEEDARKEFDRLDAEYGKWLTQCAECGAETEWDDAEQWGVCSVDKTHAADRF